MYIVLKKSDLSQIQSIIRTETAYIIQHELEPVKKDIKVIKSNVRKIKKTTEEMALFFDKEDVKLHKRVERIETHLGLAS